MANANRRVAFRVALSAVSIASMVLVTGCGGRTILHGGKYRRAVGSKPASGRGAALERPHAAATKKIAVWFVKPSSSGDAKLVPVERPVNGKDRLSVAVHELLDGPSADEDKAGLGTEIPRGTVLIGINKDGGNIELNVSKRFATPGGTSSFETRLEQLRRTVASAAVDAPVYLDVEGKRLNVSEGEGIEVRQPINR